jgi:transposase
LSVEDEASLLNAIEQKASKGLIKTANDIRAMVEARVGKAVSDDFLWDLLNRNGWKKKMPRPHHPKRNTTEQQEFKKNSPTVWVPSNGI